MKNLSKQALVLAALALALNGHSREHPRGRRGDDTDRIDETVTAPRGSAMSKNGTGHYADVNGLRLYYEIYLATESAGASGEPLILLHGGVGSVEMFGPILPTLSRTRMIIAVDLQAHGRTADIDRPLRFELMADDIAELIKHLRIKRADVLGYSLGGGVALRTAIQNPGLVRKVIAISAPCKQSAWYPEIRAGMANLGLEAAEAMKSSPLYRLYAKIAPKPQDWPVLIRKLGELLPRDYDWSKEVAAMKAPTMLVFGDADAVRTQHAVEFFEQLGGGKKDAGWDGSGAPVAKLAILPGFTHYNILDCPVLATLVNAFLDAPMPKASLPDKTFAKP
jgi:pimeloyl-ACP methyl ester carboxylesterase